MGGTYVHFRTIRKTVGRDVKEGREGLIGENQGWLKSGILTPGLRFEA